MEVDFMNGSGRMRTREILCVEETVRFSNAIKDPNYIPYEGLTQTEIKTYIKNSYPCTDYVATRTSDYLYNNYCLRIS